MLVSGAYRLLHVDHHRPHKDALTLCLYSFIKALAGDQRQPGLLLVALHGAHIGRFDSLEAADLIGVLLPRVMKDDPVSPSQRV